MNRDRGYPRSLKKADAIEHMRSNENQVRWHLIFIYLNHFSMKNDK